MTATVVTIKHASATQGRTFFDVEIIKAAAEHGIDPAALRKEALRLHERERGKPGYMGYDLAVAWAVRALKR